jgi:MFS family permease
MVADTVGARSPLLALMTANAVSLLGNVVAAVAIPWFVLVTTGSVARTGVAAFFTTLPLALGALFGGAVADRMGARKASVASDVLSAAAVAAIPLLDAVGELDFTRLLVLAFLGSLFDAPGQAAREALLPEAAARARTPLERATALWTTTEHAGYVLGAPAAGVLIATLGAPSALWVDAATFAASAAVVASAAPAIATVAERRRYLRDLAAGLLFVARERILLAFLITATVGNFLIAPLAPVILPVYARQELGGASDLAVLVGAYGAGGLAGALAFATLGSRAPRRPLFLGVWIVYPALSYALVALPSLPYAAAVMLLIGAGAGMLGPVEQLVRQERTPPQLRARVFATFMASLAFAVPPATLLAGLLVDAAGLRITLAAIATGNAALALFVLAARLDRRL